MRHFLFFLILLTLSSCANIAVNDFGNYWDRGYVDPVLVGQWEMTTPKSNNDREEARSIKTAVPFSEVTNDNGTFRVESLIKEERDSKDYQPGIARILNVGKYKFLMSGSLRDFNDGNLKSGIMIRFTYANGQFLSYDLNGKRMEAFLRTNFSANKNINAGCAERTKPVATEASQPEIPAQKSDKDCQIFNTRIAKFDDSVFEILKTIPDTPEFWSLSKDSGALMIGNRKK